jgi:hypothetical protein
MKKKIKKIEELILEYQDKLPPCFSSKEFRNKLRKIINLCIV